MAEVMMALPFRQRGQGSRRSWTRAGSRAGQADAYSRSPSGEARPMMVLKQFVQCEVARARERDVAPARIVELS
jgi:hypothetical protein